MILLGRRDDLGWPVMGCLNPFPKRSNAPLTGQLLQWNVDMTDQQADEILTIFYFMCAFVVVAVAIAIIMEWRYERSDEPYRFNPEMDMTENHLASLERAERIERRRKKKCESKSTQHH